MNRDDPRRVRVALSDPRALCHRLGLLDGARGREWEWQWRGVSVRCPWHEDRGPSCSVTIGPDGTVRVACFGCGRGGDALSLVAAVYHLDEQDPRVFREILHTAAALAGITLEDAPARPVPVRPPPPTPLPPLPPEFQPLEDEAFAALAARMLEGCSLDADAEASAYLDARCLLERARAEGWCALPASAEAREELRAALIALAGEDGWLRSGLAVREGKRVGQWVWADNRLVIPWRNPEGTVLSLQRRLLRAPIPERHEQKYVFPAGRRPAWPYGIERLRSPSDGTLVFVEGAVDTLALRAILEARGDRATVLGLPGVASWRGEQGPAWAALGATRCCALGFDQDDGNQRAKANVEAIAAAATRDLLAAGARRVDRWRPKGVKDWGDAWVARRRREAGLEQMRTAS